MTERRKNYILRLLFEIKNLDLSQFGPRELEELNNRAHRLINQLKKIKAKRSKKLGIN